MAIFLFLCVVKAKALSAAWDLGQVCGAALCALACAGAIGLCYLYLVNYTLKNLIQNSLAPFSLV